ncbi:MAG: sigma-70 family RNA polymerase sigma factor [Chthoniobacteraceae bacterium]
METNRAAFRGGVSAFLARARAASAYREDVNAHGAVTKTNEAAPSTPREGRAHPSAESHELFPWLDASARFATTRWGMVFDAAAPGPDRLAALDRFCRTYWYPVYAFIRRRSASAEDARDLTQGFFAKLVEREWLAGVEQRETRFSTLLLTMLQRFLVNEGERAHAAKRGAGAVPISIDLVLAESWFGAEPITDETPHRTFERRWALAVLAAALDRLRTDLTAAGKARHFDALSPFLSREAEAGEYAAASATLEVASRTIAVAVHRLRVRYREMLRDELACNSLDAAQVDEEMAALYHALAG